MKKVFLTLIFSLLVVAIVTYVLAAKGSISVLNDSGVSIYRLTVTVDGVEALKQEDFKPGESVSVSFDALAVERISIATEMPKGGSSSGTIEPGWFASIKTSINAAGDVDFGATRFSNASIRLGSWE